MESERFLYYLQHPDRLAAVDVESLQKITGHYPWFTTARVMLARVWDEIDPVLAVHLLRRPRPEMLLYTLRRRDFVERNVDEIVDDFLELDDVRIRPATKVDTADLSAGSVSEDPALATEELAEIYRAQGLKEKAQDTYRKLSLLYPEKSVYFAELIAAIERELIADPVYPDGYGGGDGTGETGGEPRINRLAALNIPRNIDPDDEATEE